MVSKTAAYELDESRLQCFVFVFVFFFSFICLCYTQSNKIFINF